MQCQSVKTASKLVRIHILRAHKASFRSGPLQCYDTRARFLSVTDFSTISYNVHYQIRSQKKPLANVFEELKTFVDGYNQIKANKKVAEAIQTFYFHCGQDAVQLPSAFRRNVLNYHRRQSVGHQDDRSGRNLWRQDSILVSIMRLHLAE
ncbi:hypothetical protein ABG067_007738, partial [Albugo candida]